MRLILVLLVITLLGGLFGVLMALILPQPFAFIVAIGDGLVIGTSVMIYAMNKGYC